jgi:MFS family permease
MTADVAGQARGTYRGALRHRDFRLLSGALAVSATGSWAYNVALVVYVYQQTHSPAWVAAATLGRFLSALLFSSYAGVVAERFERVRVLVTCDLTATGLMAAMATAMALHAHSAVVIAIGALNSILMSAYDPATSALIPQVVGEKDLAAANGLKGTIDNLTILVGPALGGAMLAAVSPAGVIAFNAGTFVVSAALVSRAGVRSVPTDVTQDGGPLQQIRVGYRAIVASRRTAILVWFSVLASFFYGTDTVLFAVLSKTRLGTGEDGYGYLLAALGVGGVLAAGLVNRLAASPRLALMIVGGMAVYCVPTAVMATVHSPEIAFVLQVIRGGGTLVVDTLAITALQRTLAPDLIARVFGAFWALVLGGISIGALITPALLHGLGTNGTLLVYGAALPLLVVGCYPMLAGMDREAVHLLQTLEPRIAVLQRLGIFASASRPVLERVARTGSDMLVEPGLPIVTEGEAADDLYVLLDGSVQVSARGEGVSEQFLRTLEAPAYFGEIGLLERIPRTATVRAGDGCRLLRIAGDEFLNALNEAPLSPATVSGVRRQLERTHPTYRPSVAVPEQAAVAEQVFPESSAG